MKGQRRRKKWRMGPESLNENSAEAAEYRMQQRERESEIDRVLAEAKAKKKRE